MGYRLRWTVPDLSHCPVRAAGFEGGGFPYASCRGFAFPNTHLLSDRFAAGPAHNDECSASHGLAVRIPLLAHSHSRHPHPERSEEHTSELQSLMRISYAVFCLKKKQKPNNNNQHTQNPQ